MDRIPLSDEDVSLDDDFDYDIVDDHYDDLDFNEDAERVYEEEDGEYLYPDDYDVVDEDEEDLEFTVEDDDDAAPSY